MCGLGNQLVDEKRERERRAARRGAEREREREREREKRDAVLRPVQPSLQYVRIKSLE